MSKYEPAGIEPKWQSIWEERGVFLAGRHPERPKFYVLEMLPYPLGRLHMGHVRNYSIGDVLARVKRMQGFDVMHPMGWDAFGMPAENAAIKAKAHPRTWTYENIAAMRKQLKAMGLSYDWTREVATCDPEYYRWEQQLFIEMWERGLVYRKGSLVNWCPTCATVLANEQVEQGTCWRCHGAVTQRELEQWFFRITAYADELLTGHDEIAAGWPEQVLTMQKNWIGKSEGAEVRFALEKPAAGHESITVFTTRPDTLFGATFLSLAAEHPLVAELSRGTGREAEVSAFVEKVRRIDRAARLADAFEKEGVFTGATCRNPATGAQIPIYAANFVLMEYGTGAVMAVPAHDQRDFEFARKYGLPIRVVIQPPDQPTLDPASMTEAYVEAGTMVSSGRFDGLPNDEGKRQIVGWLAEQGLAKPTVNYRLRDWGISRQRYWGAPIPMVHCPKCGVVPVKREDLPITLPDDVSLTGEGGSPLARHPTWSKTVCPRCGGGEARRETDTMDTFVESSWYFLRYLSPHDDKGPFDRAAAGRWMSVDQYIGGIEHAVMHLLYARFFVKVLRDMGYVRVDEPFTRLLTQGMVCKETYLCPTHEWLYPEQVADAKCTLCGQAVTVGRLAKMSKSHNNVVDPDKIISEYGADTARVFTLFAAPPERDFDWKLEGVEGAYRFLGRVWRIAEDHAGKGEENDPRPEATRSLRRAVHKTIRRVSDDVTDRFHFNTAIAAIMELVNSLTEHVGGGAYQRAAMAEALRTITLLLSPFAPHFAEELWAQLGGEGLCCEQVWPQFDADIARDDRITVVVQVNGKLRGRLEVDVNASEDAVRTAALADPNVRTHLAGREPKKVIVVPGRLVDLVV